MPQYSYECPFCQDSFEIFSSFANYKQQVECPECRSLCERDYCSDHGGSSGFVKLADSEIKTVGHLAARNGEKYSEDYKQKLHHEHNEYRYKRKEKTKEKYGERLL